MKLVPMLLLSLSVVIFIIGVHQTMLNGIANSYFIFMLNFAILLYYFRLKQKAIEENSDQSKKKGKHPSSK